MLREKRLRRQRTLNAAFARVARVSLKVEVVVRRVEKVVIWEEEEGEEDEVARLHRAARGEDAPEERH